MGEGVPGVGWSWELSSERELWVKRRAVADGNVRPGVGMKKDQFCTRMRF